MLHEIYLHAKEEMTLLKNEAIFMVKGVRKRTLLKSNRK
jgi:hypothetical protein